jgi:hypothetical protein
MFYLHRRGVKLPGVVSAQKLVPVIPSKVRAVARLIYKRTTQVIGLNVVYLLIFNNDSTKHMRARE